MIEQVASSPLLEVSGLSVAFGRKAERPVVRDVDLQLTAGEMLGIVGGSGSGKTTSLRAILGHVPRGATVTAGSVRFRGDDLLRLSDAELARVRGAEIAMIVQNPAGALNPLRTVGDQMQRIAQTHARTLSEEAQRDHLRSVGILDDRRVLEAYPHELSGGMAQRVLIAIAIALEPAVILADEPTSALDVTVQAQIMELLMGMVAERQLAIVFVTHDIALVGEYCDRATVMNAGRVVESGPVEEVIYRCRDECTRRLVEAARPALATLPRSEVTAG